MTYLPEGDQKEYMIGLLVASLSILFIMLIHPVAALLLAGVMATGSAIYLLAHILYKRLPSKKDHLTFEYKKINVGLTEMTITNTKTGEKYTRLLKTIPPRKR